MADAAEHPVGQLVQMQANALCKAGVPQQIVSGPTLFDMMFADADCINYPTGPHRDPATNARYNAVLRESGIFKSPGKLYPSLALTEAGLALSASVFGRAASALGDI